VSATAHPPTAPQSRFADVQGRRLHFLEWGSTGSPTLVLVHGLRDNARSWHWLAAELAPRFHIFAPDLRGHGDSDWAGCYDLPDYLGDLAFLLAGLGLAQTALVGHSLGGHIAVRYAASYPEHVTSLCAIEGVELPLVREQRRAPRAYPVRLRDYIEANAKRAARTPRYYTTLGEAEARMAEALSAIPADMIADLARHGTIEDGISGVRWKYDNAARLRAPEDANGTDLDEILMAIACPTLLAYGDRSWVEVPPLNRLAHITHHRVVRFTDASHWLHLEAAKPFLAVLRRFLDAPAAFIRSERSAHA
jgi:pimeloyl-ACP methyl ester carboxylesterase